MPLHWFRGDVMGMTKSEFMAKYINDYYSRKFKEKELANIGNNYIAGRITEESDKKNQRKKRGIR